MEIGENPEVREWPKPKPVSCARLTELFRLKARLQQAEAERANLDKWIAESRRAVLAEESEITGEVERGAEVA